MWIVNLCMSRIEQVSIANTQAWKLPDCNVIQRHQYTEHSVVPPEKKLKNHKKILLLNITFFIQIQNIHI